MKVPITWLEEYVDIDMAIPELAHRLTLAGLEVEEIRYVGLPMPEDGGDKRLDTKISGFSWDPEKIVVGAVKEVMPHPNADRLVLCSLDDGEQEHTVLTGAPNLFPYLEEGELDPPLKVAYAREGATIVDAYSESKETEYTTIQRKKIRGVESYSMACSERELGISDEHEGVIILDEDAPTGMPLVEYMGDAVLDIAITPNIARAASILGVAREVAAITDAELKPPSLDVKAEGSPIEGQVRIEITDPELNPRFVLGLIENVDQVPSPYWVQRRLRLAGIRPIDSVVDATNYTMLEIGEPLHAFDFDVLKERAEGGTPTIITRTAKPGETLTTLDDVERELDEFTELVTDTAGALSIAGVMGGAESEVGEGTKHVLLEGAAWNFINIHKTVNSQNLSSEASYRFERGVHPDLASQGVLRCLEWMRKWAGGTVAEGLVDEYPLPPQDPVVDLLPEEVERWLGVELSLAEIQDLLERLAFEVEVEEGEIRAKTPPHRLDIGEGIVGRADLLEEIARVYGYDRIPETRLADALPPQRGNVELDVEERIRDILAGLGLREVVTYRITSPAAEARRYPPGAQPEDDPYVTLENPITTDRTVMRKSLLASVLEIMENNYRVRKRMALFEIGPEFYPSGDEDALPEEVNRLVITLTGPRTPQAWQGSDTGEMDFYDLKGIIEALFRRLHIEGVRVEEGAGVSYHPGKCARVLIREEEVGLFGEIHPQVRDHYEFPETPVVAAEFSVEKIIDQVSKLYDVASIPEQPPVLEDLAVVVEESVPAIAVADLIRHTAGDILADVRLFDVYRGDQIEEGKKSLAYNLVYQHPERTLTDEEVRKVRESILYRLERELDAHLRA
ncbi:MAG: phenylalanine--tRNA ligase subunit beta [Anaerolineales bacterium]